MRNNSYEQPHSAGHNFQIMLLLLSITRHLWPGESKWKYGLGTQNGSSCQMQAVCFLDFFLESKFLPWMLWGFCAGSRHLDAVQRTAGKISSNRNLPVCPLSKGISKNLGSKWRNHKTGWLFWNALQWMGCSSGSGMKPGTGLELVGFGWDMSLLCCHSPVSSAEHFFVL